MLVAQLAAKLLLEQGRRSAATQSHSKAQTLSVATKAENYPAGRRMRPLCLSGKKVDERATWREQDDKKPNQLVVAKFVVDAIHHHPDWKSHEKKNEDD